MKIAVISQAKQGKDTLCEIVSEVYNVPFVSSTYYIAEHIVFPLLKDKYGYRNLEECLKDKVNHRKEWAEIINKYNEKDLTKLATDILSINDFYCGIRCKKQLEASKHLFDLIIWVDAEERLGLTEDSSSITVTKDDADIIIENNADLNTFKGKITRLFDTWFAGKIPSIEDRQENFRRKAWAYYFKNEGKYSKEVVTAFISYWNRVEGRKLKHETVEKFYLGRRLNAFSKKQEEIEKQNRLNRFKNYLGKVNPEK